MVGLVATDRVYGQETVALADAATAQDVVNLKIAFPLLVAAATRAARGSLTARLCRPGFLALTAYNYAIFAFDLHFGPLFLLWTAVLGLSVFAFIGALSTLDAPAARDRFAGRAMPFTAGLLVAIAAPSSLLWLGEIIPDLLAAGPSRSASDWNVPTKPVHVLDLALFLPAVAASGVLLVFLAPTCLPILATPMVAAVRGHEPDWTVLLPIGVVLAATLTALWRTMRRLT